MKKRSFMVAGTLGVVLAALCMNSVSALQQTDNPPNMLQYSSDFTAAELQQYQTQVCNLNSLENLMDIDTSTLSATITFSDYLTFDEAVDYIKQYDLDVEQMQLRALDEEGTRFTMMSRLDLGYDKTYEIIESQLVENNINLVGVTSLNAIIKVDEIQNMQEDERTYLVDTSMNPAVYSDNQDQETTMEFPQPVTWNLENLGVLSFE